MGCSNCKRENENSRNRLSLDLPIISNDSLLSLQIAKSKLKAEKIYLTDDDSKVLTSSSKISKNAGLFLWISSLKELTNVKGEYFPKISIYIYETDESITYKAEDCLGIEKSGKSEIDLKEIKVKIPFTNLYCYTEYKCDILLKDNFEENKKIHISFRFKLSDNNSNEIFEIKNQIYGNISVNSINDLFLKNVYLLENEKIVDQLDKNKIASIDFNSKIVLKIEGIDGLVENSLKKYSIGFSTLLFDEEGNELFYKNDLFPAENCEYTLDELSDFTPFIYLVKKNFKPDQNYTWICKLWDKNGEGEIGFKTKFFVNANIKIEFKILEINKDSNKFIVKLRGREGYFEGIDFKCCITNSKLEKKFRNNLEKFAFLELRINYENSPELINVLVDERYESSMYSNYFALSDVLEKK